MKKIALVLFFTICIVIVYAGLNPRQDSSSKDYFAWLEKHQSKLKENQSLQALILRPEFTFDEIELVEISPGAKYFSLWGHVMLRLKGSGGESPESDLAISFLADFNDFPVNDFKASTGGYVTEAKVGMISTFEQDYKVKEGRQMLYHKIKTNQKSRELFLKILQQWIKFPSLPGGYSFFYNNCVSLMVKLLSESGIIKPGLYGYWPKYVPHTMRVNGYID